MSTRGSARSDRRGVHAMLEMIRHEIGELREAVDAERQARSEALAAEAAARNAMDQKVGRRLAKIERELSFFDDLDEGILDA